MTELAFARRVAFLLVSGHIFLFLFGFLIALGGHLNGFDITHLALMGSPVLLATALPAFQYVNDNITRLDDPNAPKVHKSSAQLIYLFLIAFFTALVALYSFGLFRSGYSPDNIKIGVGVIETGLGGFLGITRKRLFPDPPRVNVENDAEE